MRPHTRRVSFLSNRQQRQLKLRRRQLRRLRSMFRFIPAPRDGERVFWQQLEDREFGQLAMEADHLFDTSYPWA